VPGPRWIDNLTPSCPNCPISKIKHPRACSDIVAFWMRAITGALTTPSCPNLYPISMYGAPSCPSLALSNREPFLPRSPLQGHRRLHPSMLSIPASSSPMMLADDRGTSYASVATLRAFPAAPLSPHTLPSHVFSD
jgi:hypothetical protein